MTHVANMFTHPVVYLTTDAMPSSKHIVRPLVAAVSTSGLGLEAQRAAIARFVEVEGFEVIV
jgi:hypothetical protein